MPNKYITDIERVIQGPLEDLEQGRCDLVEVRIRISRKKITGDVRTAVRKRDQETEEEEDEH